MEQACIDGDLAYITANAAEISGDHVIACCERGQIDVVKHIKTVAESAVSSALFVACRDQMCDVVDMLAPLKPKMTDPFAMVCLTGNIYIFDALIRAGYSVNSGYFYYKPLFLACSHRNIDLVHRLYIHGANMNVIELGDNVITYCETSVGLDIESIKVLIDYGVSLFIDGEHVYNSCRKQIQAYMIEAGLYTEISK